MKVPFVNYPLQYKNLKKEIDSNLQRIFSAGDLIYRSDLINFEKKIADFTGRKYGIGVDSCTGAMFISLYGAGIGPGDEVITVSHTYVATIDVIVHCGATPVLVDVRDDFNMDPDLIEEAITKRTRAIIPVHLNGRICEMDKIMKIANRYNLVVVEDAAQAIGAEYKGKKAGSFGLTGCFSFYPAKILASYGEAGMAVTDNKKLAEKLYVLRDHGEMPSYLRTEKEKKKGFKKINCYGFNTILDNLQAAVLNVKFNYLPQWIKRRREIARLYQTGLSEISEILLPSSPNDSREYFDVFQNYVIRTQKREALKEYLEKKGVETLISWPLPNHKQKALKNLHRFQLPITEQISKEVLSLPMYPELENERIKYVIGVVKSFYE